MTPAGRPVSAASSQATPCPTALDTARLAAVSVSHRLLRGHWWRTLVVAGLLALLSVVTLLWFDLAAREAEAPAVGRRRRWLPRIRPAGTS